MTKGLYLPIALLALAGQSMAQSSLRSEILWIGSLTWVTITIILAGAAFAFLATDWQIWLSREAKKRILAPAISIGLITFIAVSLGCAGIILGWSHLEQAKNQYPSKDIQSMYSSALALYLATYGFLFFYCFCFFNQKRLGFGGVFWALAVISAIACGVLLFWLNVTGFGIFLFFPFWLFVFGVIMFVIFNRHRDYICQAESLRTVYHGTSTSQYSAVSGPHGSSAVGVSSSTTKSRYGTHYEETAGSLNF